MNKINLKKFEAWGEHNIPKLKKRHPFLPNRVIAAIEKIGLPPLNHLQSFNSMYIYGENGTGKTVMAAQYMLGHTAFQQACMAPITSAFVGVPELLMQFRETFGNSSEETEREVLERYSKVHLLVLDDLGTQLVTDWSYTMLYMLINNRYEDMSPTIITSNYSLEELSESLGDSRITSRLYEMCDIVENKKQYRHA